MQETQIRTTVKINHGNLRPLSATLISSKPYYHSYCQQLSLSVILVVNNFHCQYTRCRSIVTVADAIALALACPLSPRNTVILFSSQATVSN